MENSNLARDDFYRLLRVYETPVYHQFSELCRESHSNVTAELNRFMRRCAKQGRLIGRVD